MYQRNKRYEYCLCQSLLEELESKSSRRVGLDKFQSLLQKKYRPTYLNQNKTNMQHAPANLSDPLKRMGEDQRIPPGIRRKVWQACCTYVGFKSAAGLEANLLTTIYDDMDCEARTREEWNEWLGANGEELEGEYPDQKALAKCLAIL